MQAGRCWLAAALAAAASMSAGVRARQMIVVNGNREFAARFVIVERSEQTIVEQRELLCLSSAIEIVARLHRLVHVCKVSRFL